jgi:hypothetical protein
MFLQFSTTIHYQDPTLSGATVTPTSEVRASAMSLLAIVENHVEVTQYEVRVASNDITLKPNLIKRSGSQR